MRIVKTLILILISAIIISCLTFKRSSSVSYSKLNESGKFDFDNIRVVSSAEPEKLSDSSQKNNTPDVLLQDEIQQVPASSSDFYNSNLQPAILEGQQVSDKSKDGNQIPESRQEKVSDKSPESADNTLQTVKKSEPEYEVEYEPVLVIAASQNNTNKPPQPKPEGSAASSDGNFNKSASGTQTPSSVTDSKNSISDIKNRKGQQLNQKNPSQLVTESPAQDAFLSSGRSPKQSVKASDLTTVQSSVLAKSQSDNPAQSTSENKFKQKIRFLFVPSYLADFNAETLGPVLDEYVMAFGVDLVVVLGDKDKTVPLIRYFDQDIFPTMMVMQDGVIVCNEDFISRVNSGFMEFENFVVQLYKDEIDGNESSVDPMNNDFEKYSSRKFANLRSSSKPSLVFASPNQLSAYDLYIQSGISDDKEDQKFFVQNFESNGFIDIYNAMRYSAPTIGTAHPGYTYADTQGDYRTDFVLFKDMVPSFADTFYISGLSDLQNIRRYGILGEVYL